MGPLHPVGRLRTRGLPVARERGKRYVNPAATAAFPGLAAEVVEGGQPLYQFLIALE